MAVFRCTLAVMTPLAMLLPFVTVTSCDDDRTVTTLRLFDMLSEEWFLSALSSVIALVFIVLLVARDASVGDASPSHAGSARERLPRGLGWG